MLAYNDLICPYLGVFKPIANISFIIDRARVITDVKLIKDEPRLPLRGHWLRSSVDGLIAQLFLVGAVVVPVAPDLLKHRYGRAGNPCGKVFLRSGARISIWAFRRRSSTTD